MLLQRYSLLTLGHSDLDVDMCITAIAAITAF